jgi:hypothetical protein
MRKSEHKIIPMSDAVPEEQKLTPAQAKLIAQLLTGCSVRAAAKACGVGEKTAFNYLNMPHVKAVLQASTDALLADVIERSQLLAMAGLDKIKEIMDNSEADLFIQLRAATVLASRFTDVKPQQADQTDARNIDWSVFSDEEIDTISAIFKQAEARLQA